jgi:hypothetical protein
LKLPAGVFTDVDQGDTLVYSATLSDGSALPSWLKFDAATGTFSGTAPKQVASFDVRLTATDKAAGAGANLSVSDVFRLYVDHGNNGIGNGVDAAPSGQLTDKDTPWSADTQWLLQSGTASGVAQAPVAASGPGFGGDMFAALVGVHGLGVLEHASR